MPGDELAGSTSVEAIAWRQEDRDAAHASRSAVPIFATAAAVIARGARVRAARSAETRWPWLLRELSPQARVGNPGRRSGVYALELICELLISKRLGKARVGGGAVATLAG